MAYFVDPLIVNFETDADLSSSAYRPVRLSSGKLVLATGTGSSILGALTDDVEDGSSDTVSVPVALAGVGSQPFDVLCDLQGIEGGLVRGVRAREREEQG